MLAHYFKLSFLGLRYFCVPILFTLNHRAWFALKGRRAKKSFKAQNSVFEAEKTYEASTMDYGRLQIGRGYSWHGCTLSSAQALLYLDA